MQTILGKSINLFLTLFLLTTPSLFALAQDQKDKQPERERPLGKYDQYVSGLMNQYDKNRDGYIEADERKQMRRPPDAKYDLNSDGRFSKEEMIGAFQNARQEVNRRGQWSRQQLQDSLRNQQLSGLVSGSAEDITALMNQLASQTQGQSSESPGAAFIEFDLFELDASASPEDFTTAVAKLNSGNSNIDSLVSRIAHHQLVRNRDSLNFSVVSGKKSVIRSGGSVKVSNDGRGSRSNAYSMERVGIELVVQPEVIGDQVVLQVEASKTGLENRIVNKHSYDAGVKGVVRVEQHPDSEILILKGEENDVKKVEEMISLTTPGEKSLKNFEFKSTLVCSDGQAFAALFFESDRNWMLIVRARVKP